MINVIIVDDEPLAQDVLETYVDKVPDLNLVAKCSNAFEANEALKSNDIDLMFLDIHLPKISGIDFLKTMPNPPHVILTTAFSDYALESYEFSVVDYLLKPFSFQRFVKAVAKIPLKSTVKTADIIESEIQENRKEIFIKSGYEHIKITIEDIVYIKSDTDYTIYSPLN